MKLRITLTPSDVAYLDSLNECQSNRVTEPVAFTRAQLKRQLEQSLAREGSEFSLPEKEDEIAND